MKNLTKFEKLLVLDLLIVSFGNDRLLKYGTIGYYIAHFTNINEKDILVHLSLYLQNTFLFEEKLKASFIDKTQKERIKLKAEELTRITLRHADFPGEKNNVLFNIDQITK